MVDCQGCEKRGVWVFFRRFQSTTPGTSCPEGELVSLRQREKPTLKSHTSPYLNRGRFSVMDQRRLKNALCKTGLPLFLSTRTPEQLHQDEAYTQRYDPKGGQKP